MTSLISDAVSGNITKLMLTTHCAQGTRSCINYYLDIRNIIRNKLGKSWCNFYVFRNVILLGCNRIRL
jgi:hypothetical protein